MAIAEWISTLEFVAASPDGTVRARRCGSEPVAVKLSPAAGKRHSETSLAGQVEAAVQDVLLAYDKAVDNRRYGDRGPAGPAGAGDYFAKRHAEFQRAAVEVTAVGASTFGHVKIGWRGIADIQIRIGTNAISQLNRDQLTGEIDSAIAAVMRSRSREILRLSERFYPVPLPPNKGGSHE